MPETPLLQNISLFLDDKPSVYALRERARQLLLQCGYPTIKTEAWKYTDIRPILNVALKLMPLSIFVDTTVAGITIKRLLLK